MSKGNSGAYKSKLLPFKIFLKETSFALLLPTTHTALKNALLTNNQPYFTRPPSHKAP